MSSTTHPEALTARRPFAMPGWGVTVIALFVLVAAVAAGVVIGNNTATEETAPAAQTVATSTSAEGLAPAQTVTMVDNMLAAWSSGDGDEIAKYFTEDAALNSWTDGWGGGPNAIIPTAKGDERDGVSLHRTGPVVDAGGGFIAHPYSRGTVNGIVTYWVRSDGLIGNMWMYGYAP